MKRSEKIAAFAIVLLMVAAMLCVYMMNKKYNIVTDLSEVKEKAERLYGEGNIEEALTVMDVYCNQAVTDIEASAVLGDWYMELGREAEAAECYKRAAMNKRTEDGALSVTVKNGNAVLKEPISSYKLTITPDVRRTMGMTLKITSANLFDGTAEAGRINKTDEELIGKGRYMTTAWFPVSEKGSGLTMTGGFNAAVWQFRDKGGEIIRYAESTNTYRNPESTAVNNYQMARVEIPPSAAECRVTYLDNERGTDMDEPLSIVFGKLPKESEGSFSALYQIPDLYEGDRIVYENGSWTYTKNGKEETLLWDAPFIERGSYVEIGGTLPGRVDFSGSAAAKKSMDGIYTVGFLRESPEAVGVRMDDAFGLGFNASAGNEFLAEGESDFDEIYPWSEMRLCAIKDGKVTYEGEYGFSRDGSAGDVFVEIPKFYSRRIVEDGYDKISVSGVMHEGFSTDEAFITPSGEADRIYIAAYLSSEEDGRAASVSGKNVKVNSSAAEIEEKAIESGYQEMDYAAYGAIQKLFCVETAMRSSQLLYMGVCAMRPKENGYFTAVETRKNTNTITLEAPPVIEGARIALFGAGEKDLEAALPDAREIVKIIDNGDGTKTIYFSGEPMSITAGVTRAFCIAQATGGTDALSYHTAAPSTARGTVSFKYRNIENLWGNAEVYIDKIRLEDGSIFVTDRRGKIKRLSYGLPLKNGMIKSIGFDQDNPSLMLPESTGATASTYTGDMFTACGGDCVFAGGSFYSREEAGIFALRTGAYDERILSAAGRMMYVGD